MELKLIIEEYISFHKLVGGDIIQIYFSFTATIRQQSTSLHSSKNYSKAITKSKMIKIAFQG